MNSIVIPVGRIVAAIMVIAALVSVPQRASTDDPPAVVPQSGPIRIAVAGDSITAFGNGLLPAASGLYPTFVSAIQTNDWDDYLQGQRIVGGYAHATYTSGQIAANVQPVPDAQVLVIHVSTNDEPLGTALTQIGANVEQIAAVVGVEHVVLSAVPPRVGFETVATNQNALLRDVARSHGWTFVDPWAAFRTADGGWLTAASPDGIHPSPSTASAAASLIQSAVRSSLDPRTPVAPVRLRTF